ncbi:unnamed protein product [Penicillium camemberti]|uniref:Str. FM013 n=1 Tax=Penicillium camemberti (strain FM 013) TaxID=1429867 RepID=A0A0G4P4L6_PENC3|nr:unnamed protein product [Penicillium camemberti]
MTGLKWWKLKGRSRSSKEINAPRVAMRDREWAALNETRERRLLGNWPITILLQALSFRHIRAPRVAQR